MSKEPVYCMHCLRWYASTKVDQCDIPVQREISVPPKEVIGFELSNVEKTSYGYPSKLNKNNDCSYYKEISFLDKIFRRLNFRIPLKHSLESLAKE